jgi:hypothetical protein
VPPPLRGTARRSRFATLVLVLACACGTPARAQSYWLTPSPGSLDYLDLTGPEWLARIDGEIRVIQFYLQHLLPHRFEIVGPNTYAAFVARDAFRHINGRGIAIAMEAGVVKSFWCDDVDARAAFATSSEAIRNVQAAGARVDYVSMDEPFVAGVQSCRMLDARVADRTVSYMKAMRRAFPSTQIGLTEAYPLFGVDDHARFDMLLRERGGPLDFYHLDVHLSVALEQKRLADIERDVGRLGAYLENKGVPFGLIIWGADGRSDFLYTEEAMKLVRLTRNAFRGGGRLPSHVPLQSWTPTPEGLLIVPRNLRPEDEGTHLNLLRRTKACLESGEGCAEPTYPSR